MTTVESGPLRAILASTPPTLIAGVHDAIGAVLADRSGFDALWASGLGISTAFGVPDASVLTMTELMQVASSLVKATTLPVICDCDTGFGEVVNIRRMVREAELIGLAAVCIEDKEFPKHNSFRSGHHLAEPPVFAARIGAAVDERRNPGFLVIARVEALIAGRDMDEALARALLYVQTGADAIVIHSKEAGPAQVLGFAKRWREVGTPAPLIVIPTTYPQVTARILGAAGVAGVIYANQTLRASVRAMDSVLHSIKQYGSSAGIEDEIAPVSEVFALTDTDQVDRWEESFAQHVEKLRQSTASNSDTPR